MQRILGFGTGHSRSELESPRLHGVDALHDLDPKAEFHQLVRS